MCDYIKPLMAVKIRVGTLALHDSTEGIAILGLLIFIHLPISSNLALFVVSFLDLFFCVSPPVWVCFLVVEFGKCPETVRLKK